MNYDNVHMRDELERLKGKPVIIDYNGLTYKGVLSGADETDLYLQTATDWVTLPMAEISSVREDLQED